MTHEAAGWARVLGWKRGLGLIFSGLLLGSATAQSACIAPAELQAQHLYGLWRAEFDDGEASSVLLERHPEYPGSVRGAINRQSVQSRLAGDVDDGELVLDESDDGQRISAVWTARATPAGCGREFRGTRRVGNVTRGFVLRRVPGWN